MYTTTADIKKHSGYAEYLPSDVKKAIERLELRHADKISEIRIKNEGYVSIYSDKLYYLGRDGTAEQSEKNAIFTGREAFAETVDKMSRRSVYAAQNELRNGFLTLEGGHRVGVCGKTVTDEGRITQMHDISSLNIRIAREVKGCAEKIIDSIMLKNTLIISPPSCGKTTLLRDISRLFSERMLKVGIVDERGELASVCKGKPRLDVGKNTDIYTNCPKNAGIVMLLRSMSPDVIITDEVGTREDEEAIFQTINAGVKIVCSAHGYDKADLQRRGLLGKLLDSNVFEKVFVLSRKQGPGTIEKIY